jgi:hypothetical protein
VECEFRFIVNKDFKGLHPVSPKFKETLSRDRVLEGKGFTYVAHKSTTNWTNFLREGGTKHHDLLVMRGHFEDFLDITTHI